LYAQGFLLREAIGETIYHPPVGVLHDQPDLSAFAASCSSTTNRRAQWFRRKTASFAKNCDGFGGKAGDMTFQPSAPRGI